MNGLVRKLISVLILLLSFLGSLVEVNSQTQYPYVTLRDQVLPNNSYVDILDVGGRYSDNSLTCHTNLDTCCHKTNGIHRGSWYSPNHNLVGLVASSSGDDVRQTRGTQNVSLYNRQDSIDSSQVGILYSCVIDVLDVDYEIVKKEIYIGIYNSEGQWFILCKNLYSTFYIKLSVYLCIHIQKITSNIITKIL